MDSSIRFFNADHGYRFRGKRLAAEWIVTGIKKERRIPGDISIIFCTDPYLKSVNSRFLDHHYFTDIITFPDQDGGKTGGELYISIDRVRDNAAHFDVSLKEELLRVIAHGVLHLCGYGDKTASQIREMRKMETSWLASARKKGLL